MQPKLRGAIWGRHSSAGQNRVRRERKRGRTHQIWFKPAGLLVEKGLESVQFNRQAERGWEYHLQIDITKKAGEGVDSRRHCGSKGKKKNY